MCACINKTSYKIIVGIKSYYMQLYSAIRTIKHRNGIISYQSSQSSSIENLKDHKLPSSVEAKILCTVM